MIVNFFMLMICFILVYHTIAVSVYIRFLREGLGIGTMIAAEHNLPIETVTSHTNKAVQQITAWNEWRRAAFVSLLGMIGLWMLFHYDVEVSPLFIVFCSVFTGYVASKILGTNLVPDWAQTWKADMIRVHDIHTLKRVSDRIASLADVYLKQIAGTLKMSPAEQEVIELERKTLNAQIARIKERNSDLVKE